MTLKTNADLYRYVTELCDEAQGDLGSLEEYLMALLVQARMDRSRESLSIARFAELLGDAVVETVPSFNPAWRTRARSGASLTGFDAWEATLLGQIVDLREMEEAGMFDKNPALLSLGLKAPSGARWCNFEIGIYLECAVAGTFGGLLRVTPDGKTDSHINTIAQVDWETFRKFLLNGQGHE